MRKKKPVSKSNVFNTVLVKRPGKNAFDLSHSHTTSFNMGELIPISAVMTLPGDYFNVQHAGAVRFQPMVTPPFARFNVKIHSWFVPLRILMNDPHFFERWIADDPAYAGLAPVFNCGEDVPGTTRYTRLCNYLGIPNPVGRPGGAAGKSLVAWKLAAYQMIWNSWYRSEKLQTEVDYQLTSGDNSSNNDLFELRRVGWNPDYLTGCLPEPQQGAAVDIPVGGFDDVPVFRKAGVGISNTVLTGTPQNVDLDTGTPNGVPSIPDGDMFAQTSDLINGSATLNDLRTASAIQRFREILNRAGTRFKEFIKGLFGEDVEDYRLDLPEFVHGTASPISINEVLNTTGTDDAPQGDMAGHGIGFVDGKNHGYRCKEHGVFMTMAFVMPLTAYQDGIDREWFKTDPLEWWNPQWDGLGEQAVMNGEVWGFSAGQTDYQTWGYNPKGSEYRYVNSLTTGDFQSSLDNWVMTRQFSSLPGLNADFIQADPTHRIFAVTDPDEQKVLAQFIVGIIASRPMSKYGTPQLW